MEENIKKVKLTQNQMQFIMEVFNAISVNPTSPDAITTVSQVQGIIKTFNEALIENIEDNE